MPVDVKIPQLGESITEAEIVRWFKANGDEVAVDEPLAEIETDKATAELPSPASGILEIVAKEGSTVKPGDVIARIQESKGAPARTRDVVREPEPRSASEEAGPATADASAAARAGERARSGNGAGGEEGDEQEGDQLSPAVRRLVEENRLDPSRITASGRGGRLTKEDVLAHLRRDAAAQGEQRPRDEAVRPDQAAREIRDKAAARAADEAARELVSRDEGARDDKAAHLSLVRGPLPSPQTPAQPQATPAAGGAQPDEERVRMSRLRRSIAQRLVEAQHTAAILTTFNEIDMSRVMELRSRLKDKFAQAHGVSLGFMSFFARACVLALKDVSVVNARIEGDEVVYSKRVHLGIAASTDRGLVVPVVRNADLLGMAELEREISRLAELARSGRIGLEDLTGGTFTISNGGVFGSLMSTPILNPPQSAILGMHKIEQRPVVIADQIVARPMMYVAVSYDHRLVDGREAVTFLVRVKERIEDPERLLLEV